MSNLLFLDSLERDIRFLRKDMDERMVFWRRSMNEILAKFNLEVGQEKRKAAAAAAAAALKDSLSECSALLLHVGSSSPSKTLPERKLPPSSRPSSIVTRSLKRSRSNLEEEPHDDSLLSTVVVASSPVVNSPHPADPVVDNNVKVLKKLGPKLLEKQLVALTECCESIHINVALHHGHELHQWIENTFNNYADDNKLPKLSLTDPLHDKLTSRLNDLNAEDFSVGGSVPGMGNCGFDSAATSCVAAGQRWGSRALRNRLVDSMKKAFHECDGGLLPIFPITGNENGRDTCFLEFFQLSARFGVEEFDIRSDAERAADKADDDEKQIEYNAKMVEYERAWLKFNALAKKKGLKEPKKPTDPKPPEREVRNPVTAETEKDSEEHLKAKKAFSRYVTKAAKKTTWLDEFMLIFLPRVLGRPVHVYSIELREWSEYLPLEPSMKEPIHLLLMGDHFAPLIVNKNLWSKRWQLVDAF
jgi:hypothetical protein